MFDAAGARLLMRLRIAKIKDADGLAEVYLRTASELPGSFLPSLGHGFLARYHQILISEPGSVVICLEDESGRIVGFASGTSAMEEHAAALSSDRLMLVLSALPAIAKRVSILVGMYKRFRAVRLTGEEDAFVLSKGPRLEYWGCIKGTVSPTEAIELMRAWLAIFRRLGGYSVSCEVDLSNDRVLRIHKAFGARVERKFITGDGRERFVLKYDLNDERTRRAIGC